MLFKLTKLKYQLVWQYIDISKSINHICSMNSRIKLNKFKSTLNCTFVKYSLIDELYKNIWKLFKQVKKFVFSWVVYISIWHIAVIKDELFSITICHILSRTCNLKFDFIKNVDICKQTSSKSSHFFFCNLKKD